MAQGGERRGERAVALHHRHHRGEVTVQLRRGRPQPHGGPQHLLARDPVPGEEQARQRDPEVIGARRQEDRLVREPEQREQDERGSDELRSHRRRHQRAPQERVVGEVERDVEDRAPVAAEDGQAGPERHLGRARAAEVERSPERRIVAAGERAAAAAEPEPLEGHAPQDRLLEGLRGRPPRSERRCASEPGRERAEEAPPGRVGDELEQVDEVDGRRRPVALCRPGLADHLEPPGRRLLPPLPQVIGRQERLRERHGRRLSRSEDAMAPLPERGQGQLCSAGAAGPTMPICAGSRSKPRPTEMPSHVLVGSWVPSLMMSEACRT